MKTLTKKKPAKIVKIAQTLVSPTRKTVYVSSSRNSCCGEGTREFPMRDMTQVREWLLQSSGRRRVRIKSGDTFDGGIGSLAGCGNGRKDHITFEPWGEGRPVFLIHRGTTVIEAPSPVRATVRGMQFQIVEPWYVRVWRWLTW